MNSVIHFEIPAEDMSRAEKFYSEVFGWQLNKIMEQYYLATTTPSDDNGPTKPGGINGAIGKKEGTRTMPIIVMDVQDINEHVKKVEDNGGKLLEGPMKVFEMGMYAVMKDTEDNTIGIWQTLPTHQS